MGALNLPSHWSEPLKMFRESCITTQRVISHCSDWVYTYMRYSVKQSSTDTETSRQSACSYHMHSRSKCPVEREGKNRRDAGHQLEKPSKSSFQAKTNRLTWTPMDVTRGDICTTHGMTPGVLMGESTWSHLLSLCWLIIGSQWSLSQIASPA